MIQNSCAETAGSADGFPCTVCESGQENKGKVLKNKVCLDLIWRTSVSGHICQWLDHFKVAERSLKAKMNS